MKIKVYLLSSGILISLFGGCTTPEDRYAPVYEIFEGTPIYHIHISDSEIADIDPEKIETIRAPKNSVHDVGLGYWPVVMNDSLLVVDVNQRSIKSIDIGSGELLGEYSFTGGGPGEYLRIDHFFATEDYLFIVDRNSAKIILYDQGWKHLGDYFLEDLNIPQRSGFVYDHPNFFYPVRTDVNYLIHKKSLEKEDDPIEAFHKRIISLGKRPQQYNRVILSISQEGELVVANPALPFLFFYNQNRELNRIYRIQFPGLDLIKSSPIGSALDRSGGFDREQEQILLNPPPVDIETDRTIRTESFIIDINHADNRFFLYYANRYAKERFLTVLQKKGEEWIHTGSYRFYKEDGSIFTVFNLTWSEPWLYLASQFEEDIIRVNVDELKGF